MEYVILVIPMTTETIIKKQQKNFYSVRVWLFITEIQQYKSSERGSKFSNGATYQHSNWNYKLPVAPNTMYYCIQAIPVKQYNARIQLKAILLSCFWSFPQLFIQSAWVKVIDIKKQRSKQSIRVKQSNSRAKNK